MIIGTRKGLTRSAPFVSSTLSCSQIVSRPPTPVPISVPARSGSPRIASIPPASLTASSAAAAASWTKRSARRTSFGPNRAAHVEALDRPHPADRGGAEQALPERARPRCRTRTTTPRPVTTTRRPPDGPRAVGRAQDSQHQSFDATSS